MEAERNTPKKPKAISQEIKDAQIVQIDEERGKVHVRGDVVCIEEGA